MNICIRKNHSVLLAGLLLMLMVIAGQTNETFGAAMCKRAAPGESCSAAWDFAVTPRAFYWVERFVYESNDVAWQSIAGPFTGDEGVTDQTMEGGFLYRVVGCNDKTWTNDCIGSTVFWAPSRPKSVDDIPDVVNKPGGYYLRSRRHSAEEQVITYNMALVGKLVATVDMNSMPPMTELPFGEDLYNLPAGTSILDATIDLNAYIVYPKKQRR